MKTPVNIQFGTNPLSHMKSTTKAKRLPADLQTAVDTQFQRSDNKARRPYEHDHAA